MVKYNREKLEELLLYIATRYRDDSTFGVTRLTKVLFWADYERFRQTGEAIAGGTYIKMPRGPMLYGFQDLLKGLEGDGSLRLEERSWEKGVQKSPVALREPNLQSFTPDEIALVDRIIEEHRGKTAADVSDLSHELLGWQAAPPNRPIPYGALLLSKPQLTPEEIEYGLALSRELAAAKHDR